MARADRYLGCLLGLATGDALGTTLEFSSRGSFSPMTDMTGGGPFRLKPGEWTDDTAMALCLAESLVEKQGFDPRDQMERYLRWYRHGHLSSTGVCFDIGGTTRRALEGFERSGDPFSGQTGEYSAGNGSIMRLAPVPMAFASRPGEAIERSAESSKTTHAAPKAVDACRYLGGLITGALNEVKKGVLLSPGYSPVERLWERDPLDPAIQEIADGAFKGKPEASIRASGYVVHTLEAALWAFHETDNFQDGCLLAVNLGEDADTTGAVFGQLAGAYYGIEGIPAKWVEKLAMRAVIERYALGLLEVDKLTTDF